MPQPAAGEAQDAPQVTVLIPTFDRNDLLKKCLESCVEQRHTFERPFEIVVVDNSPDRRAEPVVEAVGAAAAKDGGSAAGTVRVRYVSEPNTGISHARNAGFAAAKAPFLAMIDDDEFAGPTWLKDLWATLHGHGVDCVFGSVKPVFEGDESTLSPALRQCFAKNLGKTGDNVERYFSTCNCLLRRSVCEGMEPPFSPARNFTGGEDHLFFYRLKQKSCKFIVAPDVSIFEHIPRSRLRWGYLLSRSFRRHQILVQNYFDLKPRRWGVIAKSMAVGPGQFLVYGGVAVWLALTRSGRAGPMFLRSVGGLGKLIWFQPFQANPYKR